MFLTMNQKDCVFTADALQYWTAWDRCTSTFLSCETFQAVKTRPLLTAPLISPFVAYCTRFIIIRVITLRKKKKRYTSRAKF